MSTHRAASPPPTDGMLTALLEQTLDPAYAEAAQRRGVAEVPPRGNAPAVVAALLVAGLILGVAYADTRAAAPSSERARLALVADVQRETVLGDDLQQRLEQLRAEVSLSLDEALTATRDGRAQAERVRTLENASGVLAVSGPGLRVTVSDAAPEETLDPVTGEPIDAVPEAGLVLDLDLQAVVNGLWAAGAEAIAVGGQRLSSTSSIRTAGEAILVDFRPVTSPYVVEAIGGEQLVPRFAGSDTAARYDAYRQLYGIGFELVPADTLDLPAAADTDLRFAGPVARDQPGETE